MGAEVFVPPAAVALLPPNSEPELPPKSEPDGAAGVVDAVLLPVFPKRLPAGLLPVYA